MDEAAFNRLIEEKLSLFQSVALRILGNVADADEAVQLALLAAWDNRGEFRREAAFSSWVLRILTNKAYNLLRKRRGDRCKHTAFTEWVGEGDDADFELVERLNTAIGKLPAPYRETMEVLIHCNLDGQASAERLGCKPNALYQRVSKAKRMLRRLMEES